MDMMNISFEYTFRTKTKFFITQTTLYRILRAINNSMMLQSSDPWNRTPCLLSYIFQESESMICRRLSSTSHQSCIVSIYNTSMEQSVLISLLTHAAPSSELNSYLWSKLSTALLQWVPTAPVFLALMLFQSSRT